MAYEAFARAIEQISGQYAHNKREEQLHERDRSERKADTSEDRAYADKVRADQEASQMRSYEKQLQLSYEDWVKKSEKSKDDELRSLGIEPTPGMSPQEKFTRRREALRVVANDDAKAAAIGTFRAGQAVDELVQADPKTQRIIAATQTDLKKASAEMKALAASDPRLAGKLMDVDTLAAQKAAEFLATADRMPPAQRDAAIIEAASALGANSKDTSHFWQKNNKTSAEDARRMILSNPLDWARARQIITPKTEQYLAQSAANAMRSEGFSERPEVARLAALIAGYRQTLVGLGVTPDSGGAPSFFQNSPDAATTPAGAQPVAAPPTGPVLRAPGSPAATPGQPSTFFAPQAASTPNDPLLAQADQIRARQSQQATTQAYHQSLKELNDIDRQIAAVRTGQFGSGVFFGAGGVAVPAGPSANQLSGDDLTLQRAATLQKLLAKQAAVKSRVDQMRSSIVPDNTPTIVPDEDASPVSPAPAAPATYFSAPSPISPAPVPAGSPPYNFFSATR